jgi:hypothetical protein
MHSQSNVDVAVIDPSYSFREKNLLDFTVYFQEYTALGTSASVFGTRVLAGIMHSDVDDCQVVESPGVARNEEPSSSEKRFVHAFY